jgi:hypothetical protein
MLTTGRLARCGPNDDGGDDVRDERRWALGRAGAATVGSLLVIALTLGACSGGDGADGVATLGGGRDGTTGSTGSSIDPEDALAEFAECMRDNGFEDFPDPQVDENGAIVIGGPGGGGGLPDDADFEEIQQAMEACQELLPQGLGPGEISEEDQAALQDAFLEYAQCMRDNGIDMPDPDFSGEGGAFGIGGEGIDPGDPDFQAADEVCRPLLEEVLPDAPGA